jgi:F0F1-type ATP synthase epsilon subunit
MSDHMSLEIITTGDQPIKSGIQKLYIPTIFGETGILVNHRPYIALLETGEIYYTDVMDKNHYLFIREGFMEVNENHIVIISDFVETDESLVLKKESIENKLTEIENKIKSLQKIEPGMTEKQIEEMPKELEIALKEQTEFEIKRKIIQKAQK